MKNIKYLKLVIFFAIGAGFWGCSSGEGSDEASKLLQKQTELQTTQTENLNQTQQTIEGALSEMVQMEDSLNATQSLLAAEKQKLQSESQKLAVEKLKIQEERQKEALKELQDKHDSINKELTKTTQSLSKAVRDSVLLSQNKDSLSSKSVVVSNLETEVQDKLMTGIKEVDAQMEKLGKEKRNLEAQISLNEQKTNVANKKIEVLNNEKSLYESQKSKLYSDGAPQSDIDAVAKMIASVEENIEIEKKKVKTAKNGIESFQESIEAIDKQRESLSENIRKKYTTKELMEEFMEEEKARLANEMVKLDTLKQQKIAEAKSIAEQKANLEKSLNEVEKEGINVQTKELEQLAAQKATLEQEMANLSKQEAQLTSNTTAGSSSSAVSNLEKEYQARQEALAKERNELATAQQELADQEIMMDEEDSNKKGKASNILIMIVGIGVLLFGGLYFLGKKAKQKKTAKA